MTKKEYALCHRVIAILTREGGRGIYDGEQARRFDRATDSMGEALELAKLMILEVEK